MRTTCCLLVLSRMAHPLGSNQNSRIRAITPRCRQRFRHLMLQLVRGNAIRLRGPGSHTARIVWAARSCCACSRLLALDPHGLDVAELEDAELRQLAPVAALLDPAEGQPCVRAHVLVDEREPRVEFLCRDALTAGEVPGQNPIAQTEARVVDDAQPVSFVLRTDDGGYRTEHLLVMGGLTCSHVGEHCRRIPGARPSRHLTAEQDPCPTGYTLLDLLGD